MELPRPKFVKTWVQLADVLEVDRKSLDNWKKLPGAPRARSDGRKCVVDWLEFIESQIAAGNIRSPESFMDPDKLELQEQERYWKVKRLKLAYDKDRELVIDREEVKGYYVKVAANVKARLRAKFENELPPKYEGLSPGECQKLNRRALDEVLAGLSGTKYESD